MGKRPLEVAPEAAELASLLNVRFTEAGFSQARISRELSISRPRVAAILDASSAMTVSELLQLSALLDLEPGQLLAEAEARAAADSDVSVPLPDDWGKRTATPADLRKQCSQIFWGLNGAYLFDSNCAHA